MAHSISQNTAGIRFEACLDNSISQIEENYVAYPRINFLTSSISPLYTSKT
jgi:hypothetical protein